MTAPTSFKLVKRYLYGRIKLAPSATRGMNFEVVLPRKSRPTVMVRLPAGKRYSLLHKPPSCDHDGIRNSTHISLQSVLLLFSRDQLFCGVLYATPTGLAVER